MFRVHPQSQFPHRPTTLVKAWAANYPTNVKPAQLGASTESAGELGAKHVRVNEVSRAVNIAKENAVAAVDGRESWSVHAMPAAGYVAVATIPCERHVEAGRYKHRLHNSNLVLGVPFNGHWSVGRLGPDCREHATDASRPPRPTACPVRPAWGKIQNRARCRELVNVDTVNTEAADQLLDHIPVLVLPPRVRWVCDVKMDPRSVPNAVARRVSVFF